jgi:MtN3 and saliva related transmembrane protein
MARDFNRQVYMDAYTTYIGLFAGVCTCMSMLPQLIKIIREKKAEDISYGMLIILFVGVATWTWYGVLIGDLPIIVTNSVSCAINLMVIGCTMRYKK